ncbi:MAG: outer membrane beta-barrel family protein, partial [Paramuribaculum sp.]|nr:outer membrane beta-barrel family protein [Paramuribaculum sp.]
RYIGSFNINRFWNGNQLTLLGNANNINELGFTDGNGQRFRRFGGTNGITTSQALGVNFNVGNQEIFRVGGNVMWSRTSRDTRQNQERTYLFTDSMAYASIGKQTLDRGQNIRADFRIQWKPDEYNSLDIAPRISYNHNHSMSADSTITRAGDAMRSLVSNSFNTGDSRGDSWEYGLRVIYNHQFRNHRGRSFSIMANYSHSDIREEDNSYSRNIFYLFNDSTDIYDQRADNHTWNNSLRARLSWTEPLGDPAKGNFLTIAYGVNSRWNNADKLVYDRILLPPLPEPDPALLSAIYSYAAMTAASPNDVMALDAAASEVLNSDLSNRFRNDFFSQDVRVGYKHVSKSTTLDVGVSVVPTMSKSVNLINDAKSIPTRWVTNFAPFLRYRYKISKSSSLQMNYNGRSSQPSMTQLQPVPDMSDPLRVVIGNPLLDPSFTHNVRLRYQDFNSESQRSLMLMGFFSLVQ